MKICRQVSLHELHSTGLHLWKGLTGRASGDCLGINGVSRSVADRGYAEKKTQARRIAKRPARKSEKNRSKNAASGPRRVRVPCCFASHRSVVYRFRGLERSSRWPSRRKVAALPGSRLHVFGRSAQESRRPRDQRSGGHGQRSRCR